MLDKCENFCYNKQADLRGCWNRQTGKLEVLVSVLACGFKSHFPHQCKGHSIFRVSFIFISGKKRKLKYIYMQNLFIFKLQFIFTYFKSKITVIILSVPIIGLITQYIDNLLSNKCCKYVFKYNNSNRNNSFLLAIITFKCYNTH